MTLVEFLTARLRDDEQAARYSGEPGRWAVGECVSTDDPGMSEWEIVEAGSETVRARTVSNMRANHIARHDPARVLRDVEAKRRIVDEYERYARERRRAMGGWDTSEPSPIIVALASVYADHPDFDPAWRMSP